MMVVWRSSSARACLSARHRAHLSAATLPGLPVACVDLVPPVPPGRAEKKKELRSLLTDGAGSLQQAREFHWKSIRSWLQQARRARLTRRSHRQKAAGAGTHGT